MVFGNILHAEECDACVAQARKAEWKKKRREDAKDGKDYRDKCTPGAHRCTTCNINDGLDEEMVC